MGNSTETRQFYFENPKLNNQDEFFNKNQPPAYGVCISMICQINGWLIDWLNVGLELRSGLLLMLWELPISALRRS